jgi:hypothetical protein
LWAHDIDITLTDLRGRTQTLTVRFPAWLNDPNKRPIGSRALPATVISSSGRVFVPTSGGGVRISGVWTAPMRPRPAVNAARLIIGTQARVRGYPAPAAHLEGATHMLGSPNGHYLLLDPHRGFWVVDTTTLRGRLIPIPSQPHCVVSQSAWMTGDSAIAYVQTCTLAGAVGFRSSLWAVGLRNGVPRRLLTAVDYRPDAISIGTVYRCISCGFNPGS